MLEVVKRIEGKRILVIGDVMLDRTVWGNVTRISPEAPIPVLNITSESYQLGGAANVAANVRSLGGEVMLCGVIGDDEAADRIDDLRSEHRIKDALTRISYRRTTVKQRFLAGQHPLLRVDREDAALINPEDFGLKHILTDSFDAVILSDYAKGMITIDLLYTICNKAHCPIIAALKPINFDLFPGMTALVMNESEMETSIGSYYKIPSYVAEMRLSALIVTQDGKGLSLFLPERLDIEGIPVQVKDGIGAGDVVVAAFGLCIAAGIDFKQAAEFANYAAAISCKFHGCHAVTVSELLQGV